MFRVTLDGLKNGGQESRSKRG